MSKVILVIVGFLFSSVASAGDVDTNYFVISKIRISASTGNIYINPVGAAETTN